MKLKIITAEPATLRVVPNVDKKISPPSKYFPTVSFVISLFKSVESNVMVNQKKRKKIMNHLIANHGYIQ